MSACLGLPQLSLARRSECLGFLVPAARHLDHGRSKRDSCLPARILRLIRGGLVLRGSFGKRRGMPGCLASVLLQRRPEARRMAALARDLFLRRPRLGGDVYERCESFLQLAHRVPALLQTRQVPEPPNVLGEHRPHRIGLRFGHRHRQELPHELRFAPEVQEVLDAALASVELDLGGEQPGVDLLLCELPLPIRLLDEYLEVAGVARTHRVQPALHILMPVEPAMRLESRETRGREVVECEPRRAPKRKEVSVEFSLSSLPPWNHQLTRDQALRVQKARLATGKVPFHNDECRYVAEVVAELLVGADQGLQEPPLAGIEAAQQESQKGGLPTGILQAEHRVPGLPGAGIGKLDGGPGVVRLVPAAVGEMDARDAPHLPAPAIEEAGQDGGAAFEQLVGRKLTQLQPVAWGRDVGLAFRSIEGLHHSVLVKLVENELDHACERAECCARAAVGPGVRQAGQLAPSLCQSRLGQIGVVPCFGLQTFAVLAEHRRHPYGRGRDLRKVVLGPSQDGGGRKERRRDRDMDKSNGAARHLAKARAKIRERSGEYAVRAGRRQNDRVFERVNDPETEHRREILHETAECGIGAPVRQQLPIVGITAKRRGARRQTFVEEKNCLLGLAQMRQAGHRSASLASARLSPAARSCAIVPSIAAMTPSGSS